MQLTALPYHSDASHYFETIRDLAWPLLLDSNQTANHFGRYDIMMATPQALIKVSHGQCEINTGKGFVAANNDAFTLIAEQLATFQEVNAGDLEQDLPFYGGAAGLFGYDYGRELEQMPVKAIQDVDLADLWIGIYPWAVVSDHESQQSWFVSHLGHQENKPLIQRLMTEPKDNEQDFSLLAEFSANMTAEEYAEKFARVNDYIHAGDCYQVCLAQRFQSQYQGHPWQAYKQLRHRAPTPFSAYMETDAGSVLSLSPERFLQK